MRTLDDKTLLLDRAEFAAMQTATRIGPNVLRETILESAVASGKIPAASRDRYREMYRHDQPGTVALLASLAPGVTPAQAKTLHEFERRQEDELLTAARGCFPELRRRRTNRSLPPVGPVAPADAARDGEAFSASSQALPSPAATTDALFPEIRQRRQQNGRITWADK